MSMILPLNHKQITIDPNLINYDLIRGGKNLKHSLELGEGPSPGHARA